MEIEVRTAGKEDIEAINEILNELQECDSDIRVKKYEQALDSKCSSYFVAATPKRIIGYLNLWHLPDIIDGGEAGIIMDI